MVWLLHQCWAPHDVKAVSKVTLLGKHCNTATDALTASSLEHNGKYRCLAANHPSYCAVPTPAGPNLIGRLGLNQQQHQIPFPFQSAENKSDSKETEAAWGVCDMDDEDILYCADHHVRVPIKMRKTNPPWTHRMTNPSRSWKSGPSHQTPRRSSSILPQTTPPMTT
ncbi:hypothetical protein OUZ56_005656 [Daphnia magna]|uniref:Ig-like domain-containing protein n=1 Tax=Daphnia magna TaxID=35525 RepID=A0ABQ9YTE1_9CRUS|nr:hypothetical protein OUZ56_005656 [Daphnia magna]